MKASVLTFLQLATWCLPSAKAWVVLPTTQRSSSTMLRMAEGGDKVAKQVTGEELEMMLTEWDKPLVIDAYATWCGPCLLMAPEFEAAAKELKGKVRFVKLDTDKEESMAARLNIMGLPTLLFLDKYEPKKDEEVQEGAKAGTFSYDLGARDLFWEIEPTRNIHVGCRLACKQAGLSVSVPGYTAIGYDTQGAFMEDLTLGRKRKQFACDSLIVDSYGKVGVPYTKMVEQTTHLRQDLTAKPSAQAFFWSSRRKV
eukprot:scaffold4562_cov178-Amphora_coffeaeformis.AAC.7